MGHPLAGRRNLFLPVLGLTLGLAAVLGRADEALRTPAAPLGVVSFELAGDAATAGRILTSWDADARAWAAFGLGLDFLFLCAYSTAIALGCLWAGEVLRAGRLGVALAWGQWVAAGLDAVENVALARILLAGAGDPWPGVAWWCAVPKFALVLAGLGFALTGAVAWGAARRAPGLR